MQHISTSYWTHAGQLRSIREAVVPENKRLDKKSILINPIVLVTRAPKLHSRHRPSRKTSKILKKLTCQPLASLSLVSSQRTGRDRYTAVSRQRPTLRRRSPTSVGRTNDQH